MERRVDLPISKLMARTLHTVSTEEPVEQVEADMNRFRVYALPIVNADNTVFGIISATDLAQFRAAKKNPKAVRAWELCTYKPLCVSPDIPAVRVAKLMITKHIHHVLVTEGKVLRGMVSTFDFVEAYVKSRRD
jgi:CBS domain-containing protein